MQSISFHKRLTGEITGYYQSKSIWGIYERKPIGRIDIRMQWKLDFESRVLRLTFTHNFGNNKVKVRKRNTASEEGQKRITN